MTHMVSFNFGDSTRTLKFQVAGPEDSSLARYRRGPEQDGWELPDEKQRQQR